ncbi:MAG: 30S ribosomal protein S14 [Alphaproteobacteria bacterium 16-39-46]|nr:MAG: 30S ribosomal protein S14 [Rhodospirillales bacterium 35-44-4]OYZ37303.1 MAG: 30S ribosomal protein S14 [Alphaproteobacteria bacterium 16-39-46]OZA42913.1 MAG: 30S ribosomal protein S14 [Alphaproteobacteria bacterium 17-39-52]HQS84223.1 30S ribosomal protein S14 [Alphaproteobacteria bacterium]HQS94074.1 30S ribosomal protein S14 [Alphaproteobacteria bacterium]
MAKKSAIEKNERRIRMVHQARGKRERLKKEAYDKTVPLEERFEAILKLAAMPRNSARVRIRNRCAISGRPRGYYRKFRISRIAIRDLASEGQIPGMTKSSW